jgi:DnaJ family protein A protein 5
MRKEGEILGLNDQEGEEVDVEEKQIAVGDSINDQGTPEPPRALSSASSQTGITSELPTRDPSPEHDLTKTNNRCRKNGKKVLLEPLSKTEKRVLRRNQQLGDELEQEEVNGHMPLVEEDEEEPTQTPELSKRDKRRAKQAKKAESNRAAEVKEVCSLFPSSR